MELFNDPRIQALSPKLIPSTALRLLGCLFYGDPFHSAKEWSYDNEIGHLWNRFYHIFKKYEFILEQLNVDPDFMFEVHIEPIEYKEIKKYNVFVGISIENETDIPIDLFLKPFPLTQYLTFTTRAMDHDAAEYVFRHWLMSPNSQFIQAYPYAIQRYNVKKFKNLEDPSSEINWMIPIKPKIITQEESSNINVEDQEKPLKKKKLRNEREK
jgi:AraC family transcriptional regulator